MHLKPYISELPDVVELPLDNTADFLILGCDGVWAEVTDDVRRLVLTRFDSFPPQEAVRYVRSTSDPLTAANTIISEVSFHNHSSSFPLHSLSSASHLASPYDEEARTILA